MSSNTRSPQSSPLGDLIRGFVAPLAQVLGELEPRDVPLPYAEDVLDAFVQIQKIGENGALLMADRAAEFGAWRRAGSPSAADWLAKKQGTTTGRAKADLKASGQLGDLPDTAGEVKAGNLSAEQAGAVADAASVNPDCERDLIDTAKKDSLRHTREEAARRKAEVESELSKREREAKAHRERCARWGVKNHRWWVYAEGPIGTGALAQQVLENRTGEIFAARRGGVREGRDQYAYDALMDLLRAAPAVGADEAGTEGGPGGGPAGSGGPSSGGSGRVSVNRLLLVRVDLAALVRGYQGPGEVCEIPGHGSVSVHEARQMFGDSIMRLVTTNGPAVVDVINPSRRPTEKQQIAKLWTDPKCVVEGCNRALRLEFEHREDYARTRHTVLGESERMCDHDHRLKTYENWQLVPGVGRRAFVPPDDPRHPNHLTPPDHAPDSRPAPQRASSAEPEVPAELMERARRARARAAAPHGRPDDLFDDTG